MSLLATPNSPSALTHLFESLWDDYVTFNPQAKRIYDLILAREQKLNPNVKALVNDHVALRTYNIPHIGLEAMARMFTKYGYEKCGTYVFEEKKLRAWHLEHPDTTQPKVFISELECEKLSRQVQETASTSAKMVNEWATQSDSFLWSRRPWPARYEVYQTLLKESEYAAWMYAFGYRSNHFTISLNSLKSFKNLAELNIFIKAQGFQLNSAGGEIKGAPAVFLEQSSTLAEKTQVGFEEGIYNIPACYYEFAERHKLPSGKFYQGFVASSADKIFESTNVKR